MSLKANKMALNSAVYMEDVDGKCSLREVFPIKAAHPSAEVFVGPIPDLELSGSYLHNDHLLHIDNRNISALICWSHYPYERSWIYLEH